MQPLLTFRNLVYICADLLLYNAVICDKEVLISCSATSLVKELEVDDVNSSQLGEAQYAVAHLTDLARNITGEKHYWMRGTVTHRATMHTGRLKTYNNKFSVVL